MRAGHHDRHLVVEVERHRQDDFVAGIGDREDRVHERHVAAGGHHDAAVGTDRDAVLARELVLERVDELRQAFDRSVAMIGGRGAERRAALERFRRRAVGTMPWPSEIVPGVSASSG